MRKLGIAWLMLLVASGAAVPTGAQAAPLLPSVFAHDAVSGQYLRVQYDDDDGPSYQQPQHYGHHCCGGGGGFNANTVSSIIGVVGAIAGAAAQQHRIEQGRLQQQQYYQVENQRRAQQARKSRQEQVARQRENRAQQAKQKRANELANEQRQQQIDALNEQKRELAQLKKQMEQQREELRNPNPDTPSPGYPSDNPPNNTSNTEDKKDNIIINVIPSNDPEPPTLQIGETKLYPGHVDLPADRSICVGSTAKGCWLRIVSTPTGGGACIMYCRSRPVLPPRYVVPNPTPAPPPVVYPTPTPTPVVVTPTPTPPPVVYPTPTPTPTPVVVVTPTPKLIIPPTMTEKAEDYEEPKRKAIPPRETEVAKDYEEPKRKAVPPTETEKAEDYEEPKRKATPPVETEVADNYEEPKRSAIPPVKTEVAEDYEEHADNKTTKTKIEENKSEENKKTENNKTADTDPTKPENRGGELDSVELINPLECPNINFGPCAERFAKEREEQEKKDKIAREEKKKRDDEIARKKKEELAEQQRIENPGPTDSKGCTSQGDKPLKDLLADSEYKGLLGGVTGVTPVSGDPLQHALADNFRDIALGGVAAIPDVGTGLSGVAKILWKDPENAKLFNKMKKYVDQLVPDSINEERVTQLQEDLVALKNKLTEYMSHDGLYRKGRDLDKLLGTIGDVEPHILNGSTPKERLLPLLLAFGILKLTALQEQYRHLNDYYPPDTDNDHKLDLKAYNDAVDQYKVLAAQIKEAIIKNRLDKIFIEDGDYAKAIGSTDMGNIIYDKIPYHTTHDGFCDYVNGHGENAIEAFIDMVNRKNAVRAVYEKDLDIILKPIAHWPSITTPAQTVVVAQTPRATSVTRPAAK
jgi:hypothetical protein